MAITYQSQENVIDVTASPYLAKGDGTTDDTAAIQQAVSDGVNSGRLVFLPAGKTYLISGQIFAHTPGTSTWAAGLKIQGGDQATTVIKLANNQAGFQFSDTAKALIVWGSDKPNNGSAPAVDGSGNNAFANYCLDITIDIGSGNPKAQGLDWISNNYGSMENVTIQSSDSGKIGDCGLSMTRTGASGYGPCYIRNLTVDGFNYGLNLIGTEYSETWENVTVKNQLVSGAKITGNVVTALNFQSNNKVPAFDVYDQAYLVLLYSQLNGTAGYTQNQNAITTHSNNAQVYLYSVTSSNYQNLLVETQYSNRTLVGGNVGEYSSVGMSVLHNSTSGDKWGGELPFLGSGQPMPVIPVYDASQWFIFPKPRDIYDDLWDHWQDAINSGKPQWVFPSGCTFRLYASGSLVIPASLKYLKGNYATILVPKSGNKYFADPNNPKPLFTINSGVDPLFVERFFPLLYTTDTNDFDNAGAQSFLNTSNRDIILNKIAAGSSFINNIPTSGSLGNVWISDYCGQIQMNVPGQKMWCRQLNPEGPATKIINNGSFLWILGLKTEGTGIIVDNSNGAKTQILGGLVYPVGSPGSTIMLKNNESSLTAVLAGSNYDSTTTQYQNLIQETRKGDIKLLTTTNVGGRTYSSFFLAYNGIQPKDKCMSSFSAALGSVQNTTGDGYHTVAFNGAYVDTDNQFSASGNLFYCKVPGNWYFNTGVNFVTANTASAILIQFVKVIAATGTTQTWRGNQLTSTPSGYYALHHAEFITMASGDELIVQVLTNGTNNTILSNDSSNILTKFAGFLVSAA